MTADFTIYVRPAGSDAEPWPERYQKETDDPERWGREIVAFFNRTRRPGEREREFVRVEAHGEVPPSEHLWVKVTAMTQQRGGRAFSAFRARYHQRCDLVLARRTTA